MIKVTKKDGESSERLLRRFSGHVKSKKLMQKFRNRRYFQQSPRKREIREAAIMREVHRAENKRKQYLAA